MSTSDTRFTMQGFLNENRDRIRLAIFAGLGAASGIVAYEGLIDWFYFPQDAWWFLLWLLAITCLSVLLVEPVRRPEEIHAARHGDLTLRFGPWVIRGPLLAIAAVAIEHFISHALQEHRFEWMAMLLAVSLYTSCISWCAAHRPRLALAAGAAVWALPYALIQPDVLSPDFYWWLLTWLLTGGLIGAIITLLIYSRKLEKLTVGSRVLLGVAAGALLEAAVHCVIQESPWHTLGQTILLGVGWAFAMDQYPASGKIMGTSESQATLELATGSPRNPIIHLPANMVLYLLCGAISCFLIVPKDMESRSSMTPGQESKLIHHAIHWAKGEGQTDWAMVRKHSRELSDWTKAMERLVESSRPHRASSPAQ